MNLFENEKINESVFLPVSEIPFDEKNRDYCKANLCGRYGKTWNCPPAVGTYDECREKAMSYKNAFVFTHQGRVDDFSDMKKMNSLRDETMEILFEISQKLSEKGIRHMTLGCEGCNICKECTYPHSPCRFPEKSVPPVESYGIDVGALAKAKGLTYYAGDGIITYFCIILYD